MAKKNKIKKNKDIPKIDKHKQYDLSEACKLLPQISTSKFTGSCDMDVILNLKEKHKNVSIRGSIVFTHKFQDDITILAFASKKDQEKAKKAGADYVGLEDMIKKVKDGWMDFDIVIATPEVMPQIAILGKILGPKQLMPNPKSGTVAQDIAKAIKAYKSGKTDFKMDPGKTIKLKFGKCDMSPKQLQENLQKALEEIKSEVNQYGQNIIDKVIIHPTMGQAIKVMV